MPKETPGIQQAKRREKRQGLWQFFIRAREAEALRPQVIEALRGTNFDGMHDGLIEKLKRNVELYELFPAEQHQFISTCLWLGGGQELAKLFGLWPPDKYAVQVIPYKEAEITPDRLLDISPHLRDGRWLKLEILSPVSLTDLRVQLQFTISRYLKHTRNRPKRTRIPFDPHSVKRTGYSYTIEVDLFQPVKPMIEHICRIFRPVTKSGKRGAKLNDGDHLYIWEQYQRGKRIAKIAEEFPTGDYRDTHRIIHKFKK